MPTWCFKTATRHTRDTHTQQWYWQIDAAHALSPASTRLFPTIEECLADARDNGFHGNIDLQHALSHPAVITCDPAPCASRRSRISGSFMIADISVLSFVTIACGVKALAKTPNQPTA